MKKKLFSLILALTLCLSLGVYGFSESGEFVYDFEDVVSDEAPLELLAQEIFDTYGLAVVYMRTKSLEGMTGAEYAQQQYTLHVPYPDAVVLVDCAEASSYYMHYAGAAKDIFQPGDGTAMMTAFDEAGTFDDGVRDYLNTAAAILSQRNVLTRDLVLLEDTPQPVESAAEAQPEPVDGPLLSLTEPAQETPQAENSAAIPSERQLPLVVDTAGVIDPAYVQQLNAKAESISAEYKCEVAAAIVNTTGSTAPQAFADDFYDYNGYGYGSGDDGIILVVAVEDRTFAISTYGSAGYSFTDYGQQYMDQKYIPYLKNADWGGAANAYLDVCAELLEYERKNGISYDISYEESESNVLGSVLVSLLAGFGFAFFPISSMKKKMHNVRKQTDASDYMRNGSFRLDRRYDRYITSNVTRTPIPRDNNNNNGNRLGGSGGSSFHTSSSGRSHGGHSGSF